MDSLTYTTVQGDTYPLIALKAYGEENFSNLIIQANSKYSNVVVFDADVTLKIPIIEETSLDEVPPWRR